MHNYEEKKKGRKINKNEWKFAELLMERKKERKKETKNIIMNVKSGEKRKQRNDRK